MWLIVLIVLPFTAPFPTCEPGDLLGGAGTHHQGVLPIPGSPSQAMDDSSILFPPAAAITTGRSVLVDWLLAKTPGVGTSLMQSVSLHVSASIYASGGQVLRTTVLRI